MRELTTNDIDIIKLVIKEESRPEAIEILEKCSIRRYNEFKNYHYMNKDNMALLVLDTAKDELVECGDMTQKKKDFFGFDINYKIK